MIHFSETRVKFVIHEGEVLALFPDSKANCPNGAVIDCYAKVGQHSTASASLMRCKKAKPEQYIYLLQELRGIYENPRLGDCVVILKVV